jgi:hypothetical protein
MPITLVSGKDWKVQLEGAGSPFDGKTLDFGGLDPARIFHQRLNKIDPKDLGPGTISFSASPPLPLANTTLNVSAKEGASIGGQDSGSLFAGDDPFAQPLSLKDKVCLWLKLNGTASAAVSGSFSGFGIGIQGSANASYTYSRIFEPGADGNFCDFSQALQQLFTQVSPPTGLADLMQAPVGSIFEFDTGGSVKLTGSYSFPVSLNPLATTAVPVLNQKLSVKPGVSLGVSGSFGLSGSLVFRVCKISGNVARFQLFKKRGTSVGLSLDASAGVSGGTGKTDYVDTVMKALTPKRSPDIASRDPDVNKALEEAIEDALTSHFSASLNAAASSSSNVSNLFVIDVDLTIANSTQEMRQAVDALFKGGWTLASQHNLPCVVPNSWRDCLEEVAASKHTFQVHLLNIFSFTSVENFLTSAKVLRSPDGVVFTDHNTATQIQVAGDAADPKHLSSVLAQAVEATLVFKTGNATPAFLDLDISGHCFIYESDASRDDLNEIAQFSAALDCALAGLQFAAPRVGAVKFDAASKFEGGAADACFVGPGPEYQPKQKTQYIAFARQALASLYGAAEPFHAAAVDGRLWRALDDAGNPQAMLGDAYVQGFLRQQGSAPNAQQAMWLYSIWYTVTFWSAAMAKYASLLQKARKLAATLPPDSAQQTPQIQELMQQLASAMRKTQAEETGYIDARAPFGMTALYLCSGKRSANDVCLTWNTNTLTANNNAVLAAPAR